MSALAQEKGGIDAEIVPIAELKPGDSPRLAGESIGHVHTLANSGAVLPPILVHRPTMRVIDGMHRLQAAMSRGEDVIDVQFADCDEADIFVAAVAANIKHGLPLTLADRESAAARIIHTHPQWSNRKIASKTGLSHKTVGTIRNRASGENSQLHYREGADGRSRPLHTTDRRLAAAEFIRNNPSASLREVAKVVGLSVGTVRDVRTRLERGEDPAERRVHAGRPKQAAAGEAPQAAGQGMPDPVADEATTILSSLGKDPAMKLNESGREMLRLLHTCLRCEEKIETLTVQMPPHRLSGIADLARMNAKFWLDLARHLDRRKLEPEAQAGSLRNLT